MCSQHQKLKQGCRECHKLYMREWRKKRPTTLQKAYAQGFKDGSGKKFADVVDGLVEDCVAEILAASVKTVKGS